MKKLRVAVAGLMFLAGQAWAAEKRPNIVIILADDMGFSDLGCYGGEIHTPNIDRVADEGVRFTQFYNNARCCPSRASLMTGLYPHQSGVGAMCQDLGFSEYQGRLNDRPTIAERLKADGYHTAVVGKWHLANLSISGKAQLDFQVDGPISPDTKDWPAARGFEEHWGTIVGVTNYYDPWSFVHNFQEIKPETKDFYYTDFINDKAVELIDGYAKQPDKPFFMYVAEVAPHWPLHARESDVEPYLDTYKVGWDKIREQRYQRLLAMGMIDPRWKLSPRSEDVLKNEPPESKEMAWEDAPAKEWQARRMAVYAGQITALDRGIGRVMDALKRNHLDENTLVIFLSDNGGCAENVRREWYDIPTKTRDGRPIAIGNNPKVMPGPQTTWESYGPAWANASNTPFRRYKHWTDQGGIAAPFIIRWPGHVEHDGRIDKEQIGHITDLVPTCLAAAGAPSDGTLEGVNLLPALAGKDVKRPAPIFWEHEGNRAVRDGKWKLVAAHGEKWRLYDMEADGTELNDLATKDPEQVEAMVAEYKEWAKRVGVQPFPVKAK